MIKTTGILQEELSSYANPSAKIRQMVRDQELFPIIRGYYETSRKTPGHSLAPIILGPSYLSFEYALSVYGLIPEAVYVYTCASLGKRKSKVYHTLFGQFNYRDVPETVFHLDLVYRVENGYAYQIASPEKALCDMLYTLSPVGNQKALGALLFEDLRIDEEDFRSLDLLKMINLAGYYKTQNHRLLQAYLRKVLK